MKKITLKADFRFLDSISKQRIAFRRRSAGFHMGARHSRVKGRGFEFEEYKEYSRGDPLRYVDWRLFARTEKLYSRVFAEERRIVVAVVLDVTKSMFFSFDKIQSAWNILSAIAYLGLKSRDKVLISLGDSLITLDSLDQLLLFVKEFELSSSDEYLSLSKIVNILKFPASLFIISDFFEPIQRISKIFSTLGSRQFETTAIQCLDALELNPPFHKWRKIRDSELGIEMSVDKYSGIEYFRNFTIHSKEISFLAKKNGIKLARYVTNVSLSDFFIKELIRTNSIR
ncbi:MAG: DUF58 domain-containing protein [Deltaproteobacteria bacterium]|nr:DUF58 domain-containing protein [Deltaproteobacteria bacterium]